MPPVLGGSQRLSRPAQRPSRSGWPAKTNSITSAATATDGRNDAGELTSRPDFRRRQRKRDSANSSSTVTISSSRSTMTVANVAAALEALLPREQVRPQHFADPPGSRKIAVNQ